MKYIVAIIIAFLVLRYFGLKWWKGGNYTVREYITGEGDKPIK